MGVRGVSFLEQLFWRIQRPATTAASEGAKSAARRAASAVGAGASSVYRHLRDSAAGLGRGGGGIGGGGRSTGFVNDIRNTGSWLYNSVWKDWALGGKPLFSEIPNPYFRSYMRMGRAGRLAAEDQTAFNKWFYDERPHYRGFTVDSAGVASPRPAGTTEEYREWIRKNPIHAEPRVFSFNRALRKKIFVGAGLVAGIKTLEAMPYHQDPAVETVDFTPRKIATPLPDSTMDYGATGDFGLASYYVNR